MSGLGQKLRDARLKKGRDLSQIASDLRIGSRYLEAIESGRWDQLPGGFFNRSFVRQYAEYLELKSSDYEGELASLTGSQTSLDLGALAAAHDPKSRRSRERTLISVEPLRGSRSRSWDSRTGLTVAALVLLVAGGAGLSLIWDHISSPEESRQKNFAAAQAPVAPAPAAAVPPVQAQQPATDPSSASPEGGAVQPVADTSPDANAPSTVMTLNIEATESTWIEVTADGKRIFVGTLKPGDSKSIASNERARVLVGNAGGIAVRKSGRDIGPIGPRGQVRLLSVTPEAVEISNPSKPKSEQPAI